eukprot:RCo003119
MKPSSGRKAFDSTPVRRLYKDKAPAASGSGKAAASLLAAAAEEDVPVNTSNLGGSSLQDQVISAFNPNAVTILSSVPEANPTASSTAAAAGSASSLFHPPKGPGRNAPARVRANPLNAELLEQAPGTRGSSRPGSRQAQAQAIASPTEAVTDKPGWMLDSTLGFEKELEEIGKLRMRNADMSFATLLRTGPDFKFELKSSSLPPGLGGGGGALAKPVGGVSSASPPPPAAVDRHLGTHTGKPIHVPYTPDLRAKPTANSNLHTHLPVKPMVMRDYQLLAEACQRAGKARMEGHAYYKMGEHLAQRPETLNSSLKYFQSYLNICRRLSDLQGEAKALNCLGIAYQELGGEENLRRALECHQQHAEISDAAGIFIANTNMGLILGQLRDWAGAVRHHKLALQYAVRAGDKQAEALAVANLGLMGRSQGDVSMAKVCIERHLDLSKDLNDERAALQANEQLGLLCASKGEWAESSRNLMVALELATKLDNQPKVNGLKVLMGVVSGNLKIEEHVRAIARNMGAKAERKVRKGGSVVSMPTERASPEPEEGSS